MITRKGVEYYSKEEMIDEYTEKLINPLRLNIKMSTMVELVNLVTKHNSKLKDVSIKIDEISGKVYWLNDKSLEVIDRDEMMKRLAD